MIHARARQARLSQVIGRGAAGRMLGRLIIADPVIRIHLGRPSRRWTSATAVGGCWRSWRRESAVVRVAPLHTRPFHDDSLRHGPNPKPPDLLGSGRPGLLLGRLVVRFTERAQPLLQEDGLTEEGENLATSWAWGIVCG